MTRFRKRTGTFLLAAVAASLALSGCGGGGSTTTAEGRPEAEEGPVTIKFVWWGNETRTKLTQQVIDLFNEKYPDITVETEFSDFTSYFQKLSTMIAAGNAPDVIQMDEKYIAQYGLDGQLLDLESVELDLSDFEQSTIDPGRVEGTLYGATFGVNVPVTLANPAVFEKAGVAVPDDTTWTWDDYAAVATEIGSKGGTEYYGSHNLISIDGMSKIWIRESGKEQFTTDGIGFDASTITPWFQYWLDLQNAGGTPPATVTADMPSNLNESPFGMGKAALTFQWSNQLTAFENATGEDLQLLVPPTQTGDAKDANMWLKSSMYLSASADTEHPDAVLKLMEFFLNDPEAGRILGTERGIPANTEIRSAISDTMSSADQKVVAFMDRVESEGYLGSASVVPLPGGGQSESIQERSAFAVLLGQMTPEAGAEEFVDNLKSEMGV
ncbi:MAG: extracellular solute-binding protein [Propionibacteriaceae bacterium]|jgi:multiple sugar transport system substrate-binding protein|nr:extracellular solute-binding protein [Propionibacteriaceae bacterium]